MKVNNVVPNIYSLPFSTQAIQIVLTMKHPTSIGHYNTEHILGGNMNIEYPNE